MDWDASALPCLQPQEHAIEEILHTNDASGQYGLLLTREQAWLLLQVRPRRVWRRRNRQAGGRFLRFSVYLARLLCPDLARPASPLLYV